ncbi:MAG: class I SAM-dependent methyltransferase [Christensenella sp.]
MEITPRMRVIIDFADRAEVAADIGCDHGFVAVALATENKAKYVFACDISEKSLCKTRKLVQECGISNVEPVLSEGLHMLKGKTVDCIVIAGMGGMLIRDILMAGLDDVRGERRLVLAPQSNEAELRKYLYEIGYHITDEAIVLDDGHYYQIIAASEGKKAMPEEVYLHFGYYPIVRKDKVQKEFLQRKLCEYEKIIVSAAGGKDTQEYVAKKSELRNRIEEVLRCL